MARLRGEEVRGFVRWLALAAGFLLTTVCPGLAEEPASPAVVPQEQAATLEPMPAARLSKAEVKIQDALDSPTEMEFVETPLTDVATFLAQLHNIPVRVDFRALEDAAIPSDLPVTFQVRGIKLRSALKLMFNKHDYLGFHYRNEALVITTTERLEFDAQLPINRCQMIAHGGRCDKQLCSNLFIGQPAGIALGDSALAW
jgi:hypothetical protein